MKQAIDPITIDPITSNQNILVVGSFGECIRDKSKSASYFPLLFSGHFVKRGIREEDYCTLQNSHLSHEQKTALLSMILVVY